MYLTDLRRVSLHRHPAEQAPPQQPPADGADAPSDPVARGALKTEIRRRTDVPSQVAHTAGSCRPAGTSASKVVAHPSQRYS
jgi:hypothetical protein